MKTICKLAPDACPMSKGICCGICEDRHTCSMVCDTVSDWETCPDAETIHDEMMNFKSSMPEAISKITNLVVTMKQLEEQEKLLKEQLVAAMEAHGIKSFENDQIKMVYVAPTTRTSIDGTKLKKDHPDLVKEYTKTSNVSASVRITVK